MLPYLSSIKQHDLFKYFYVLKLIHYPWYAINSHSMRNIPILGCFTVFTVNCGFNSMFGSHLTVCRTKSPKKQSQSVRSLGNFNLCGVRICLFHDGILKYFEHSCVRLTVTAPPSCTFLICAFDHLKILVVFEKILLNFCPPQK